MNNQQVCKRLSSKTGIPYHVFEVSFCTPPPLVSKINTFDEALLALDSVPAFDELRRGFSFFTALFLASSLDELTELHKRTTACSQTEKMVIRKMVEMESALPLS